MKHQSFAAASANMVWGPPSPVPAMAQDSLDRDVYCVLGLIFDRVDTESALVKIYSAIDNRTRCSLATPNLNFVIAAGCNDELRNALLNSDLSVPDGMPIVWVARLLGLPLRERIAGSSLFAALQANPDREIAVYFFGGQDGIAEQAAKVLNAGNGRMHCCGYQNPGNGSVEEMSSDTTIVEINASEADLLVVSVGGIKGQSWIDYNINKLNIPVISPLGAVVNFVSGTVERAPLWIQNVGLEWIWRVKEEPKLLRRYWTDGRQFIRLIYKCVIPYALFLKLRRRNNKNDLTSKAEVQFDAEKGITILTGSLEGSSLELFRSAIKRCRGQVGDVVLDVTNLTYIDNASIGLIILLHRYKDSENQHVQLIGASEQVKKILKWNCAEFLLDAPTTYKKRKKINPTPRTQSN